MKTRISVIIPIYNVHEFLEECIDSVLAQTINDMELTDGYERNLQIILIDDGSTDDTPIIAKRYVEKYENIEYHYEENKGLGHARNYGCEFAVGDYIVFLDSDDVISPNAYEWMYKAAVKNGSDMTIGSVWRFNSRRTMMSNIHQIAFNGTEEVTHITKSPQLFYDTTAWNKLIKRSFWDKYQFKFPEGILYEDIPVTMPMHYLANNVSVIHENCYLWRIREGKSKSITQTTEETKTVRDRLYVMGLVDEFYRENVKEEHLHRTKTIKWLNIDLMIFIDKLKSVTEEESHEITSMLRDYISENINPDDFECLNEMNRLKYEYLMENDFNKLVEVLNFLRSELKLTKVYKKGGHVMFDADKEIFKTSPFIIDQFIREKNNYKYLQEVKLNEKDIEVKGFSVIPGLSIDDFSKRQYSFYLTNSNSRKRIPLEHEDVETGDMSKFNLPFGKREFSYKCASYRLNIPYSLLANDPDFYGENRIMVSFTQEGINHNFFSGSARKTLRDVSDQHAMIYDNAYFRIAYTLKDELIIEVSPIENLYGEISIEDGSLCIHSDKDNGEMYVYYPEDSLNSEVKVPFIYDDENKLYKAPLSEIRDLNAEILSGDGMPVMFDKKELLSFHSRDAQCIIDATNDYQMHVSRFESTTEVTNITARNGIYDMKAELHSSHGDDELTSAKLYFSDNLTQEKYVVDESKINDDGTIKFTLDLTREENVKYLYEDVHNLFVEYRFGDVAFSTPLHMMSDFSGKSSKGLFDYTLFRGENGKCQVRVFKKWPFYEDTPGKRLKHANISYRFFRKLPINKKRIFFESMWASKYSCNPRYLYEYIDKNYPEYECIWALRDQHVPIKGNGKRARRHSLKYFYYLATSRFLVNNVNFPGHYDKRPDQIEIQTMHGTPLKTLGLDVPGDFATKKSEEDFIEKCRRWDYLTVQSDFVANISKRCFLFERNFLKYGYPRTDILYTKNNEEDIRKLKEKMGLPLDKKVILYAPTWRLRDKFDLMLDLESFKKSLSDEYILILRLHHFSVNGWKQPPKDDFVYDLSRYDSVEELYLVSDIMITDYSSVMFDYAILDRPIILFTYDMMEYGEKLRGLYISIEENKPGPLLYTSKEVEDAIVNIEKTENETRQFRKKFQEKFIQYECAISSEKIFDEVMKGNDDEGIIRKIIRKILP